MRPPTRTDLLWRAALPAAGLVTLAFGVPTPVSGILALAGAGLAAERLVATRRHGVVDAGLLWTGGMLVGLVLTGMALGATPIGLSPTSWTVTLAVLALVGLGLASVLPDRDPSAVSSRSASAASVSSVTGGPQAGTRRRTLVLLPWLALAAVVVVVAVRMTTGPQEATEAAPVTMALGQVDGTQVQVVVSASEDVGPLEIRTRSRGNETSYPLVEITPDEATTTTVSLPRAGRFEITLANPGQTEPLRTLILDR